VGNPQSKRHKRKSNTAKNRGQSTKILGRSAWANLFASRALAGLLATFLTRPNETFYQRELASIINSARYTVQRELLRLEKAGLIVRVPRGNRVYYHADRRHPAFEDIKRVVLKTIGLGDALRDAIAPLGERVRLAFIYGSVAGGDETTGSDIDLLLVGDLTLRDVSAVLGPVGRELGKEFNPAVYPIEEFRAKIKERHHFITEVLKGEKIYLVGSENDLKGLVG